MRIQKLSTAYANRAFEISFMIAKLENELRGLKVLSVKKSTIKEVELKILKLKEELEAL